ncbi:Aste57867_21846 [Aphanomyces stellatus]|uniref:Aste57867_21846 protein n=1 Tax=Aphanomyces stellatus TaxID=120398 RepID=A0A485LJ98_9STRA|nr:hypothetical protein As57867_021777 [Aphanomyces stellatus]VFT98515.1 Aste57867_21846 [Aphanomyces stellatus]
MEKTQYPAVFIHGTLGWGRKTPFFNLGPDYWPVQDLDEVNPNYFVVEVGIGSSDHDRACETFYQLFGGRVNYGEEHCTDKGHLQYGVTFDTPMHPTWSEDNPVHLIGHSYGATTALELYQLLCVDFFGVGSNYKWVKSIISISGTLSGTTITSMMGSSPEHPAPFGSISYVVACGLATLHKFQLYAPWLKRVYDLRMSQWNNCANWSTLFDPTSKPLKTDDNVFTCLLPQYRLERNQRLIHMDKLHLFSIVSQTRGMTYPIVELAGICSIVALWKFKKPKIWIGLLSLWLWRRFFRLDWSKSSLVLAWLMKKHAEKADPLYDGFDKDSWQHSDGVVNSYSMIRPRHHMEDVPEQDRKMERCPSHVSIDMGHHDSCAIPKGQWHVYRVAKNHLCGTRGDSDAKELYTRLFRMLNEISLASPAV